MTRVGDFGKKLTRIFPKSPGYELKMAFFFFELPAFVCSGRTSLLQPNVRYEPFLKRISDLVCRPELPGRRASNSRRIKSSDCSRDGPSKAGPKLRMKMKVPMNALSVRHKGQVWVLQW